MKYVRFERLVIGVGAVAIIGSLLVSLSNGGPGVVEAVAQIMLFAVLVVAVRYGRKGGLIAALSASLVYVVLRIPVMAQPASVTFSFLTLLIARILAFGLVGIVGGEVCSRIKYVFARMDDGQTVDEWSRVYNQRYAWRSLEQARARFARYGEPFTLVIITMSASVTAELRPSRQRALVRSVANHVRGDTRMVDEVARLDDGRFLVLLPHTPKEGGVVVRDRLSAGVRQLLGVRDEAVSIVCLASAEDATAVATFADEIATSEAGDDDQDASVAYSSPAGIVRNPADRRTPSAAGSSTLSTSTAASPEGSTKQ